MSFKLIIVFVIFKVAWSCDSGQYRCYLSGECIDPELICNGEYDCKYRDDERNCSYNVNAKHRSAGNGLCLPGEYQCRGLVKRCINNENVCDGVYHCPSGDDEVGCHKEENIAQTENSAQNLTIKHSNPDQEIANNDTEQMQSDMYHKRRHDCPYNECPYRPPPVCPEPRPCPEPYDCPKCHRNRCPECPENPECPTCPPPGKCHTCPPTPGCPVCPTRPTCPTCPPWDPCPSCPQRPLCPTCPAIPPCPSCPEIPTCPTCPPWRACPECKVQPTCPTCAPWIDCPDCITPRPPPTPTYPTPPTPTRTICRYPYRPCYGGGCRECQDRGQGCYGCRGQGCHGCSGQGCHGCSGQGCHGCSGHSGQGCRGCRGGGTDCCDQNKGDYDYGYMSDGASKDEEKPTTIIPKGKDVDEYVRKLERSDQCLKQCLGV